jgi:DNA-nicking Smr family endonuclease
MNHEDDEQEPLGLDEEPETMRFPIDGILDLHSFSPKEIPDLLADYIAECMDAGIYDLRIIHGKGTGTLRTRVHSLLKKNPHVKTFTTPTIEGGGWGATLVELFRPGKEV